MWEWRCLRNRHFMVRHGALGQEREFCLRCGARRWGIWANLVVFATGILRLKEREGAPPPLNRRRRCEHCGR